MSQPMTVVAPGILVGSVIGAQDVNALRSQGVTHVLNAAGTKCPNFHPQHFQYKALPITDTPSQNIMNYFQETNAFIADARARGGSVFVHCVEGKSRSASFVIAYLMSTSGMSVDQALMQLRSARPIVNPNDGFIIQLRHYEQMLRSGGAPQMAAPPTPQSAAPMQAQQAQQAQHAQRLQHQQQIQQQRQQQQLQMQQRQQLQQQQQQKLQQQQQMIQQQQQQQHHRHKPVRQQVMVQASAPSFPQPDPPAPIQLIQPEMPRPPQNLHSEVQKLSAHKAQERAKAQRDTFAMFAMQQQQQSPPADTDERLPHQHGPSESLFRSAQDDVRQPSPPDGDESEGFARRQAPAESSALFASQPSLRSRPIPPWENNDRDRSPIDRIQPDRGAPRARDRSPLDRYKPPVPVPQARAAPQARAPAPWERSPPSQPQPSEAVQLPPWERPGESALRPWQKREVGEGAVKVSASPKVIAAAPWEPPGARAQVARVGEDQKMSPNSELISRLPSNPIPVLGGESLGERRDGRRDSDRFSQLQAPIPDRDLLPRQPSDRFSPARVVPNEELDPDFRMSELAARQVQDIINGQDDNEQWEEEDSLGAVRRLTVVGGQIAKELIC